MKQVRKDLQTITKQLDKLRKKTEKMTERVKELGKQKPTRRAPSKRNVATPTVMDQLIRVMKRHRKGVDVATLMNETGFGETKVRNTLNRAYKQGKISRLQRGIYVAL